MKNPKFSDVPNDLENELLQRRKSAGYRVRETTGSLEPVLIEITDEKGTVANGKKKGKEEKPSTGSFIERQIGSWDLVDVNYFAKGTLSARPVCKLIAKDYRGPYVGTGFLVSNRLMLTNNHNLPDIETATSAFIEFEYEIDINGFPKDDHRFNLAPQEAFWTNQELDITIVAVQPQSRGGVHLEEFGALPFNPNVGKIEVGQFISLIHHPDGRYKQAAIRENRLLKKDDHVLWYASDTAPGSSGAPCFSDQWEVVAIHRRGIPQTKEGDENMIALKNGKYMTKEDIEYYRISDNEILWLANEGTRVSVLVDRVSNDQEAIDQFPLIKKWLDDLGLPERKKLETIMTVHPSSGNQKKTGLINNSGFTTIENRRPQHDYENRNGYQPYFLGIEIPAPKLTEAIKRWGPATPNRQTGHAELTYYNFSIWMSKERRMPFVTAVNIDGSNHNGRDRDEFGDDKWVYDPRIPEELQIGNWFYTNEPSKHGKNYFDRGHIVRRIEPSWGAKHIAQLANDDTFHWTNCTPQHKTFNQRSAHWQGLEDYLLENGAIHYNKKLTLFSGPIFSNQDTLHRGVLVPKQFYKLAVFMDAEGKLRSAAYILDQSEWVDFIDFERAPKLDVKAVRRSVNWLEFQTGINFGEKIRFADQASALQDNLPKLAELPHLFG